MFTASFFHSGLDWNAPNLVSIARWPPRTWGKRRRCIRLAPGIALLDGWKRQAFTWNGYVERFGISVLAPLDARQIAAELGPDAILCCWEAAGEPCHRRLVAGWLERELGIEVPEL